MWMKPEKKEHFVLRNDTLRFENPEHFVLRIIDGKEWQMVRLYKNNYPKELYIGICSQAPVKGECVSEFSELSLSTDNVGDFRLGN